MHIDDIAFLGNGANNVDFGIQMPPAARLNELTIDNSRFSNFDTNGIQIWGDAANAGINVASVVLTNSIFTNNGFQSVGGAGDVNFFMYNGDATLSNLVMSNVGNAPPGSPRGAIQFRGVGGDVPMPIPHGADRLPIGNVVLNNIDVSGKYRNYFVTFQRYTDLANLSLNNVQLGGATSEIFGGFGAVLRFDGIGSGNINASPSFNLGNTHFRGLAGTSAQPYFIEFAPDNSYAFLRVDATSAIWQGRPAAC